MRTILRLCLVGAIVASFGLASVPLAEANHKRGGTHATGKTAHHKDARQNRRIRRARRRANRAHERIATLKEFAFGLASKNLDQDEQFNALRDLVNAATPIITQALTDLEAGLLALQAALEDDVAPALEAIDAALNDETTGLVGLNLARPQFGAFAADGTIIGGTGQVEGASGPSDDATRTGAGTYIVDFGNDVSERFYVVTLFPTGGAPVIGSVVNCSSPGDPCTAADTSPDHVLVLWQTSAGAPTDPANGFEVAALSG